MSPPTPPLRSSILAHRPFALFWSGRVLATTGFQMQSVAVGWQMYELTGSALDLGLVGLAQFLPMLVFALVTGHVADQFDRKRIVVACQWVKLLAAGAFALGSLYGGLPREAMFAVVFVFGAARAFEMPTLQALLPGIVPESMLPRAIAGSASANQAATIGGPALGGLLYALSPALAYAACGLFFLLCAILIGRIDGGTATRKREPASSGIAVRRAPLHSRKPRDSRRHLARSLRRAAGRRHGAPAHLRQGHPARRADRARHAARRARRRRPRDVAVPRAASAAAARRPDDVRGGRRVRRRDDRLRAVVVVRAFARGARRCSAPSTW